METALEGRGGASEKAGLLTVMCNEDNGFLQGGRCGILVPVHEERLGGPKLEVLAAAQIHGCTAFTRATPLPLWPWGRA